MKLLSESMKAELSSLIYSRYELSVFSVSDINGGRSSLYRINTNAGAFVLKIYQDGISLEAITDEIKVCEYLLGRGFNTSCFVKTVDNQYIICYNKKFCALQHFCFGKVYKNHSAPAWLFSKSALILGQLHTLLRDFSLPKQRFDENWPSERDIACAINKHSDIISLAKEDSSDFSSAIISDMNFKLSFLHPIWDIDCSSLSYTVSHGDYCLQQMLVKSPHEITIIDFSSCDCLPVIWELLRSFSFIDRSCADCHINLDSLKEYINYYEATSCIHLSAYDKSMLFRFYATQLLLSVGGYQEFFSLSDQRKKEEFLKFGFWRTKLMRYLIDNIDNLSVF